MQLFNRVFRSATGQFLAVFFGDPEAAAIPLYRLATAPDAPVDNTNPVPVADVTLAVTQNAEPINGGVAEDIFPATGTPAYRRMFNRGPGEATVKYGGAATGDASERQFSPGQEITWPSRSGVRVSVWAVANTTIEWERWV